MDLDDDLHLHHQPMRKPPKLAKKCVTLFQMVWGHDMDFPHLTISANNSPLLNMLQYSLILANTATRAAIITRLRLGFSMHETCFSKKVLDFLAKSYFNVLIIHVTSTCITYEELTCQKFTSPFLVYYHNFRAISLNFFHYFL